MSIAPSQILYLEHGSSRLYAEAIQVVVPRRLCWARPTLLIQGLPVENTLSNQSNHAGMASNDIAAKRQAIIAAAAADPEQSLYTGEWQAGLQLYDLEDCPDLIWPQELFEIAYDVDFFALLVQLKMNPDEAAQSQGRQQLNEFLESFWRSRPNIFSQTAANHDANKANEAQKVLSALDA